MMCDRDLSAGFWSQPYVASGFLCPRRVRGRPSEALAWACASPSPALTFKPLPPRAPPPPEDEPAAGSGWERAPAQDGSQDHAAGGRFAGVKLTVPAA